MTWQAAVHAWAVSGSGLATGRIRWADQDAARLDSADGPWISLRELGEVTGGEDWVVSEEVPLVVDLAITAASAVANTLTAVAHGLATGDGPVQLEGADLPAPLLEAADYWVIRVDADTFKLSETFLGAVETPAPVDLTDAGSGAMQLVSTDDTRTAGEELLRTVGGTRTVLVSFQCFGGPSVDANGAAARLKRTLAALKLPTVQSALRAANVGVLEAEGVQNVGAVHQPGSFEPRAVVNVRINVPIVDATETSTVIETVEDTATIT
jgi:hypothetical protein